MVRSGFTPPHVLFLDQAFAQHVIDGGFNKRRRDRLPMAIAIAVIRDQAPIAFEIGLKFPRGPQQFAHASCSIRGLFCDAEDVLHFV